MPATFTTKELTAVEEQLESEKGIIAKYHRCAQQATDESFKSLCQNMATKHQSSYDSLFSELNG